MQLCDWCLVRGIKTSQLHVREGPSKSRSSGHMPADCLHVGLPAMYTRSLEGFLFMAHMWAKYIRYTSCSTGLRFIVMGKTNSNAYLAICCTNIILFFCYSLSMHCYYLYSAPLAVQDVLLFCTAVKQFCFVTVKPTFCVFLAFMHNFAQNLRN